MTEAIQFVFNFWQMQLKQSTFDFFLYHTKKDAQTIHSSKTNARTLLWHQAFVKSRKTSRERIANRHVDGVVSKSSHNQNSAKIAFWFGLLRCLMLVLIKRRLLLATFLEKFRQQGSRVIEYLLRESWPGVSRKAATSSLPPLIRLSSCCRLLGFRLTPYVPDIVVFYTISSCLWKTLLKLLELTAQSTRSVARFLLLSCCQLQFAAFMGNVSYNLRTIHNEISYKTSTLPLLRKRNLNRPLFLK